MTTDDGKNLADTEGQETLSTTECWARLRETPVGRLAVIANSHPDIFPVNHLVDDGSLLFRTAEGTKLAGAVGQMVAFEIDGYDLDVGTAWSVVVKGQALEVTRMADIMDVLGYPLFPWHIGYKPHFVRIEPIATTGRRYRLDATATRSRPAPNQTHAPSTSRVAAEVPIDARGPV